jgi:hypothetical protein
MSWLPEEEPMLTVQQEQIFSVDVRYMVVVSGGESGGDTETFYPVTVVPAQSIPSTVTITGNGTTTVTISGYFGQSFADQLTVLTEFDVQDENNISQPSFKTYGTFDTTPSGNGVFEKLVTDGGAFEVVSFIPDSTRMRIFSFQCTSFSDTTTKTIVLQDLNWEPGKLALRAAVAATERRQ